MCVTVSCAVELCQDDIVNYLFSKSMNQPTTPPFFDNSSSVTADVSMVFVDLLDIVRTIL